MALAVYDLGETGSLLIRGRGVYCRREENADEVYLGELETLAALCELLRTGDVGGDWDDLPVFGGPEVHDTRGVWSWDEGSLLVGTCSNDLDVVPRTEA